MESVAQVLTKDRQNVEALRIYSFYLLARDYDHDEIKGLFIEKKNLLLCITAH